MIFTSVRVIQRVTILCLVGALAGYATPARAEDPPGQHEPQQVGGPEPATSDAETELEALRRRVEVLETGGTAASSEPAIDTARLVPINADNPSISFVVDTELATDTGSSWDSIGYPNGWDFSLKNAELFISAPIDPFLRGYASINGSSEESFNVEEAALVTTSLPWGLSVKGGRFFADVGRFPHWHTEGLPFVDRPPSINRLIGGESTSEGLEVAWLVPIDLFVVATGGIYDTIGADNLDDLNSNGFFGDRSLGELTSLGRVQTYVDLTDDWNVELGTSWIGVPKEHKRNLFGLDVTVRHQPGTGSFYQGLVWGTEWMWNRERFDAVDSSGDPIGGTTRPTRNGGYTYLEAFFARQFSIGARFDYSEAIEGEVDLARTASAFVTWKPSEFQRLRFQVDESWGDESSNQRFTVQWTAFIGSHSHGFAQR